VRGRISTSPYLMYVPDFTALHAARRWTAMRKRLGCGVCMPTLLAVSTRVNRLESLAPCWHWTPKLHKMHCLAMSILLHAFTLPVEADAGPMRSEIPAQGGKT
jgi:hypothetical protein